MDQIRRVRGPVASAITVLAVVAASFVGVSAGAAASPAAALARALLNDAIVPSYAVLAHPSTAVVCQCGGTPSALGLTTMHRYYIVPGPPSSVESFITTHVPRGGRHGSTGTATAGDGTTVLSTSITFPANGPHVYVRQLAYSMTRRSSSTSWLRIDSQVLWVASRTASQTVSGVISATVTGYKTTGLSGSRGDVTRHVSGKKLAALLRVFNSLPRGPQLGCMESLNGFDIVFTLRDGTDIEVVNGLCAGSFDAVSARAGNVNDDLYVLSDDSCALFKDAASLFAGGSVPGTWAALHDCETWSKSNTS